MNKDLVQLSELVDINSPKAVLEEVRQIFRSILPDAEMSRVCAAFNLVVDMFRGDYPGYRACNTEYHDLRHTTDVLLAMARIIHGAMLTDRGLTFQQVELGLTAALLHDSGYIQETKDRKGTGAKYTANHVERSADFLEKSGAQLDLTAEEIAAGRQIIICTDLAVDLMSVEFSSDRYALLGQLLGAADLLAQMADRTYLEKLLFLYYEFREAGVGGYANELDLLRRTVGFYDVIARRLEKIQADIDLFMSAHFASRWGVSLNLYQEAIDRQKDYLKQILNLPDSDPLTHLKRDGIVEQVHKKYV